MLRTRLLWQGTGSSTVVGRGHTTCRSLRPQCGGRYIKAVFIQEPQNTGNGVLVRAGSHVAPTQSHLRL